MAIKVGAPGRTRKAARETAGLRTSIIHEKTEATMNSDTGARRKQRAETPESTAELLCLLANYEAYGTGSPWSGCLRALAARGGGR